MQELAFASENVELTVLPALGGRVLSLRAFGRELLRRPSSLEVIRREPLYWSSYPLVPWCNRIPGGRLAFGGTVYQLPADFDGHAIHGHGATAVWHHVGDGRIEFDRPGSSTYPWPYRSWQRFEVDRDEARIEVGITNTGTTSMPAGLGIHPWWNADRGLEIRLPAERVYLGHDGVPQPGVAVPVSGTHDLRRLAPPTWDLDDLWTGLTERRIDLRWSEWGLEAAYEFDAACDHVVLAAIEQFGAVAIEPQTHATDGHRRREWGEPGAIAALEPGHHLTISYTIQVRKCEPPPTHAH